MKLHHSVHLVLKSFLTRDFRLASELPMEGGSTGNSRRKSYTAQFKLEVVEVAMFNNATEWIEQTSFN